MPNSGSSAAARGRLAAIASKAKGPGLGLADQLLTSVTSVVVVILAARELPVDAFGAFALIYSSATLVVGLARAYLVEPRLVTIRPEERAERARALLAPIRWWIRAGAVGLLLAAIVLVVPMPEAHVALSAVLALIAVMGLLDALRFRLLATGSPGAALCAGLAVLALAAVLVSATRPSTYPAILGLLALAYAVPTALAMAALLSQTGRAFWVQAREAALEGGSDERSRSLARHYSAEFLISYGSYYAATVIASAVIGVKAAAALRGSESLLGPVRVTLTVLPNALLATSHARFERVRVALALSGGMALWAATWCGLAVITLEVAGEKLFGASAAVIQEVLPYLAIGPVFTATSTGPILGIRYLARSDVGVRARTWVSVTLVGFVTVGSAWGLHGVAIGMASASAVGSVIWWWSFLGTRPADPPNATPPGRDAPMHDSRDEAS